jgi:hypothetical protein
VLAIHGMVIRQLLACAGVKCGVTLADREPGLAEKPRPILFVFFGASNFSGWDFF